MARVITLNGYTLPAAYGFELESSEPVKLPLPMSSLQIKTSYASTMLWLTHADGAGRFERVGRVLPGADIHITEENGVTLQIQV